MIEAVVASRLDLSQYQYKSIHAPSRIPVGQEKHVVDLLKEIKKLEWPIVVHPDVISEVELWKSLNGSLCIENMDVRKPSGRTRRELDEVFEKFPKSKLCFDIAHAKQIDGTMAEAAAILMAHGKRIKQIHISEVNFDSVHYPMNRIAVQTYQKVSRLIPENIPLILESPTIDDLLEDSNRKELKQWLFTQMDEAARSVNPEHKGFSRRSVISRHKNHFVK